MRRHCFSRKQAQDLHPSHATVARMAGSASEIALPMAEAGLIRADNPSCQWLRPHLLEGLLLGGGGREIKQRTGLSSHYIPSAPSIHPSIYCPCNHLFPTHLLLLTSPFIQSPTHRSINSLIYPSSLHSNICPHPSIHTSIHHPSTLNPPSIPSYIYPPSIHPPTHPSIHPPSIHPSPTHLPIHVLTHPSIPTHTHPPTHSLTLPSI